MKKIFLIFITFASLSLVGCSKNIEGTYYHFKNYSDGVSIDEETILTVKNNIASIEGETGEIDLKNHTATSGNSSVYFNVENDILTLDDEKFVLAHSNKYNELVELEKEGKVYKE